MIPSELQNPALWRDAGAVTPPHQWEFFAADDRWYFADHVEYPLMPNGVITFLGADAILNGTDVVCHWQVTEQATGPGRIFGFDISATSGVLGNAPSNAFGSGSFAVPNGANLRTLFAESPLGGMYNGVVAFNFTGTDPSPVAAVNIVLALEEDVDFASVVRVDVLGDIKRKLCLPHERRDKMKEPC